MSYESTLDITTLLASNDEPDSFHQAIFRAARRDKEEGLFALEQQIATLESTLHTLRYKRACATLEIRPLKIVLSPIRRLPPEILAEIFLYFAPFLRPGMYCEKFFPKEPYYRPVEPPWYLGHICHRWRAIALSLGRLWSVLDVSLWRIPERSPSPPEPQDEEAFFVSDAESKVMTGQDRTGFAIETALEVLGECLQRSGTRTLSVCVYALPKAAVMVSLFDALYEHSHRWQEVAFLDGALHLTNRLCFPSRKLSQLKKITFKGIFLGDVPSGLWDSTPELSELILVKVQLSLLRDWDDDGPETDGYSGIPWSRLARYHEVHCDWFPETTRFASYQQLTNLAVLRLASFPTWLEEWSPFDAVTLPNVRAAAFCIPEKEFYHALRVFDMPNLETLSIHSPYAIDLSLLVSRSPRLKTLRLRSLVIWVNVECLYDVLQILGKCPDLEEFSADARDLIPNEAVRVLIPSDGQLPWAPKLKILRLSTDSFPRDGRFELQPLLRELAEARFEPTVEGVTPLQKFEFYSYQGYFSWSESFSPPSCAIEDNSLGSELEKLGHGRTEWDIKVIHGENSDEVWGHLWHLDDEV